MVQTKACISDKDVAKIQDIYPPNKHKELTNNQPYLSQIQETKTNKHKQPNIPFTNPKYKHKQLTNKQTTQYTIHKPKKQTQTTHKQTNHTQAKLQSPCPNKDTQANTRFSP